VLLDGKDIYDSSQRLTDARGALSGGQQQRLCIARSLAVRPRPS